VHTGPRYDLLAPRAPAEGPIDRGALVPGEGPLELDIGFGRGMSIFERATVAPRARIVGIELRPKLVWRVEERRVRSGLDRVRVLAGDARDVLARAVPAGGVCRAAVHFPDPWWKRKQGKRRVVGAPMLDALARLLAPGGALFVQTDVEDRARDYVEAIGAHGGFRLANGTGLVPDNPFGAPSNREKRALEDGLPIHRILAHRIESKES
jgi:tRNA (guanine-N7-)-methyltransferase